jgi:hypothetical protein
MDASGAFTISVYVDVSYGDGAFQLYDASTEAFRPRTRREMLGKCIAFDTITEQMRFAFAEYLGWRFYTLHDLMDNWDEIRDKEGYRLLFITTSRPRLDPRSIFYMGTDVTEHVVLVRARDVHSREVNGRIESTLAPRVMELYGLHAGLLYESSRL